MKSTGHRPPHPRNSIAQSQAPLSLDLETAPDEPARPLGYRAYVGGVLYVEGIVFLLIGLTLLASYWPPVEAYDRPPNPVSRLGLWIAAGSMIYMIVVGAIIFFYNLWRPGSTVRTEGKEPALVVRARRYASMKKRTRYIFDNTILCEQDAEEALRAREMY